MLQQELLEEFKAEYNQYPSWNTPIKDDIKVKAPKTQSKVKTKTVKSNIKKKKQ